MLTVGIDEVGRGCWAGPVVAAAVLLGNPIDGLKDSKVLSRTQRHRLNLIVQENALDIGIGWATPNDVDTIGLTASVALAMRSALSQLKHPYQQIIIDGNYNFLQENPMTKTLPKADTLIPAVSAASIVAKTARDNYMISIAHKQYPLYRFDKHVGYGTVLHSALLQLHGVCDLHRMSYKPVKALAEA